MKHLRILSFCALALVGSALEAQTGYVVVINDANPTSSMAKDAVSRLFLKKNTKWDNGLRVRPADQAPSRSLRESFTKAVHGRSVDSIKAYWQKMIFSGKSTPPPELGSDSKILDYVRENSGGIGYVSAGTTVGNGVKVLRVTDE